MKKLTDKEKSVIYTEIWDAKVVSYIYEKMGVYENTLSEDEYFEILKIAVSRIAWLDCPLTEEIIENTIAEYMEENY